MLDTYEPHNKKLQSKADKLYEKMIKDIFKDKKFDCDKVADKKHAKACKCKKS